MKTRIAGALLLLQGSWSWAQGGPLVLTIDEFSKRAIEQGVRGKETEWTLAQAGYSRDVVIRQTAFPTLSASYAHDRSETKTNGFDSLTDDKHADLTLNEQTPLGTTLKAATQYGSTTDPLAGTIGRPSLNASVQQPLYLFVKNSVARQRRQAELNFGNAKSTFESSELSIRSQARSDYYNVMLGQESVKVQERQVASLQKLLDVTGALVDAGKSAPVEVMRSKIRLQVQQTQLDNAVAQRDQAILIAKNFIFLPLDQNVQFVTQLEFAPFHIALDRLINYALLHQPDLEILRRDQESARLNYEAAIEPTRPSVSLNGTYNDEQYQNLLLTHGWTWTSQINWLFFDSFVTDAQARSARIGRWVADLNLADGERTTRVNVRNSYIDIKNTEKQIGYLKLSLDQAVRNVDVERLRFQNGLAQLTDVFDSESELVNIENQYLGLLVQFNTSKDTLSSLIGADVETLQ